MTTQQRIPEPGHPMAATALHELFLAEARNIGLADMGAAADAIRLQYHLEIRTAPGYPILKLNLQEDADMMIGHEPGHVLDLAVLDVTLDVPEREKPAYRRFVFFQNGRVEMRDDTTKRSTDITFDGWAAGIRGVLEIIQHTCTNIEMQAGNVARHVDARLQAYAPLPVASSPVPPEAQ